MFCTTYFYILAWDVNALIFICSFEKFPCVSHIQVELNQELRVLGHRLTVIPAVFYSYRTFTRRSPPSPVLIWQALGDKAKKYYLNVSLFQKENVAYSNHWVYNSHLVLLNGYCRFLFRHLSYIRPCSTIKLFSENLLGCQVLLQAPLVLCIFLKLSWFHEKSNPFL